MFASACNFIKKETSAQVFVSLYKAVFLPFTNHFTPTSLNTTIHNTKVYDTQTCITSSLVLLQPIYLNITEPY